MNRHPHALLGAYADGELGPEDTATVARHLTVCTECARDVALIRSMGGAMRQMVNDAPPRGVWDRVHRRIARPLAWLLITTGAAIWVALVVVQVVRSRELTWEYAAFSAIFVGGILLAIGIAYEQYREWRETRYRNVNR
jgi:anti-sigma factor RsiW